MIDLKNKIYVGSENRESLYDFSVPENPKAIVVFVHGYKGYKDWGAWNLVQKTFVESGFGFIKFNLSHNGGTVNEPIDFSDLDAFGRNDYSKDLYDINRIIKLLHAWMDENKLELPIYLLGHSKGGGEAILYTHLYKGISKLVTWAAISDIECRFPTADAMDDWRVNGVYYVKNSRTNQLMPHYYSFYENYIENKERFHIQTACENINIPFLPIHGDMDLSVSISEGILISRWAQVDLEIIKGAGHTFQTKQPWESENIPEDMKKVLDKTIGFFKGDNLFYQNV